MTENQADVIIVLLGLVVVVLSFWLGGIENELQRIRELLEERNKSD